MDESSCEGITIIWKIDESLRTPIYRSFTFNWREDPRKKFKILLLLREHSRSNGIFVEKTTEFGSVRMNGKLFLLGNDGREWNLGNFENWNLSTRGSYKRLGLKPLNELPHLNTRFDDFVRIRIHLWDTYKVTECEPPMRYYIHSYNEIQSCGFDWVIESQPNADGFMHSSSHCTKVPKCFVDPYYKESFFFNMSLSLEDFSGDKDQIYIQINSSVSNIKKLLEHRIFVKCEVYLKDNEGNSINLVKSKWAYFFQNLEVKTEKVKYLKSKKDVYYPDGKLTLCCDLCVLYPMFLIERIEIGQNQMSPLTKNSSLNRMSCDVSDNNTIFSNKSSSYLNSSMFKLFEHGKLCDVVLRADGKVFLCHKAVLCARSPVFLAMFDTDSKENQSGIVDISDVDAETLSLFLSVLYKDVLEEKDLDKVKKLYEVADKYLVPEIVKMCSDYLKEKLSGSSFCEVLVLADAHYDLDLIEFTYRYFIQKADVILKSKEWLELMSVNAALTGKLVYSLSIKNLAN